MKISLIYSPAPRQVRQWSLDVPALTSVKQALALSGVLEAFPLLAQNPMMVGVWGKRAGLNQLLHENDRVEIYRKLRVDPKVARRERFSRQGTKGAGLFSAKRAGAKAGY